MKEFKVEVIKRPKSFKQLFLEGVFENFDDASMDAVDAWHESDDLRPLHIFLGMTIEEYGIFLKDPDDLELKWLLEKEV